MTTPTVLPVTHDACFQILVLDEGSELDLSPNDRGNWTGGQVGVGVLGGSRYGISSMTYPTLNIQTLTEAAAETIYLRDFWNLCRCGDLPAGLRFLTYSCAVNSGPGAAGTWVQMALQAQGQTFGGVDGGIGPMTVAAALRADALALCAEVSVQRLVAVSQAGIFAQDRLGLSRRIIMDCHYSNLPLA